MGILNTSANTVTLNGKSECFKDTEFEGLDFEVGLKELSTSLGMKLNKECSFINEKDKEEVDFIKLCSKQLALCITHHKNLFDSDDLKITEELTASLVDFQQDFTGILMTEIANLSIKKKKMKKK